MATGIIGFDRWTDLFSYGAGTGTWSADYAPANLGIMPLALVARSASAAEADTSFVATTASPLPVGMLGFVRHNSSLTAQYQIRCYADDAGTVLAYDSGRKDFWPVAYPYGSVAFEDPHFWDGLHTERDIEGYTPTAIEILPYAVLTRRIEVDVFDSTNADGYWQCGLFEIAQGWPLTWSFKFGATYGFRFRTRSREGLGGVKWFDRLAKPRTFTGEIPVPRQTEALPKALEFLRRHDLDTPFLWVPHPDDTTNLLRTAGLFVNVEPGALSYATPGEDTFPVKFEEVL